MPKMITFPNQRVVHIHRESAKSDFLGIKNTNWQYAARDLGAHCLMLYLYFASNADGFQLALSPAAITNAIGMPRSTYRDQFEKLVNKGYLVQTGNNSFDFYELPQTRPASQEQETQNQKPNDVYKNAECTCDDIVVSRGVHNMPSDNIEINNINTPTNNEGINNSMSGIYIPKVKEIRIPVPKAEPKKARFRF